MKNTVVWIILIILTASSYFVFESGSVANVAAWVLLFAGVKFYAIADHFMELSHAHLAWRIGVIIYALAILGFATG